MPRLAALLIPAQLVAVMISGCMPELDPRWLVQDLRILAVRAAPPEVLVSSIPKTFPPVRINALVVDPAAPGAPVDWELWACYAEDCSRPARNRLLHKARTPPGQIQLDYVLTEERFLAAQQADPLKGFGGVPVLLNLNVQGEKGAATAVKRLVYGFNSPAQKRPNRNPAVAQVTAGKQAVGPGWRIAPSMNATLVPTPNASDAERYWVATFAGGTKQVAEHLRYAFYVSAGSLSWPTSGGPPNPSTGKPANITSRWTAPDHAGAETIWVVVTDGRGGVGWTTLDVEVR
jgi:hypothetical protein